jgi:LCP family protein required for cell wall assembly
MRRRARLLCAGLLATVLATPSPGGTPPKTPALEIHRTAMASHLDPAKANPLIALVIGSDVREGDPAAGRADSLHVVAVNAQTHHGTIIGIPRDSWVDIPGSGMAKITQSLTRGGPTKTVEAVANLTGLPIHYWALIEFSRFRDLVDSLGGIDVQVPYKMADSFSGAYFDPGLRHMDGAEALAFSRNRHGARDGDFGRSENQGLVLLGALRKFKAESGDPFALIRYLESFRTYVSSDVSVRDLLLLAEIGRRTDADAVRNLVLPGHTGQEGPESVVFLDAPAKAIFEDVADDGVLSSP